MQYRGYNLRDEGDVVLIETLHGTVISDAADHEAAEKVIDGWQNAP